MIYPTLTAASATLRTFVQTPAVAAVSTAAEAADAVLFVCGYVNCLMDHYGVDSDEFSILENWAVDVTQNADPEDPAACCLFLQDYPFHAE